MATTNLIPLHAGNGRSIAQVLGKTTDYVKNPEKTNDGEYISAYQCDPLIADSEFLFSKRQYEATTGRNQGSHNVVAYHLRQAFKPGEITPDEANKIGYDLAMSLTKGKNAFFVCTHVDKAHVHSHIIINSVNLDCTRKFRNFKNSSFAIRKISDQLCIEHGLSVIENPQQSRGHYGSWLGDSKPQSQREQLRTAIDSFLPACKSLDELLEKMQAADYKIKRGKYLSFCGSGHTKFIRCKSLGENYTEEALRERISGKRIVVVEKSHKKKDINLLIDIQQKIQEGKSAGYERWAKIFNLKEMAKTLIFLQENNLTDYTKLKEKAEETSRHFNNLSEQIKQKESRLKEISELQKHISQYAKTRETYSQYKASGWDENFYNRNAADIILHKAAKNYFNGLGIQKLPPMKELQTEFAILFAEKNKLYSCYREAKENMIKMRTAKYNTDRILGIKPEQKQHKSYELSL